MYLGMTVMTKEFAFSSFLHDYVYLSIRERAGVELEFFAAKVMKGQSGKVGRIATKGTLSTETFDKL